MTISKEFLDELLKGVERPEDLLGDAGLMKELKIRLMERMLGAELTAHLGYEEGKEAPPGQANRSNGSSTKVLKGQDGELPVAVPRDRDSSFEPELVKKGQTRIDGMDDKIIGLYAAGLSVRDIQAHLEDLYGLRVSPDLISRVTDAVLEKVRDWQPRALDRMYPIVIFDALRVKIRDADSRMVRNKAVYIALGVTREGEREVLGLWIADNEGAKFWLSVMNELRKRGVQGGFNRSSQHSADGGCDDDRQTKIRTVDEAQIALTRAAGSGKAVGAAPFLVPDCIGSFQRGRCRPDRHLAAGRNTVVSKGWRHAPFTSGSIRGGTVSALPVPGRA